MDRVHLAGSGIIITPAGKDAMLICYEKNNMYLCTERAHLPGSGEISDLTGHNASEDDDSPKPDKRDSPKITRRGS